MWFIIQCETRMNWIELNKSQSLNDIIFHERKGKKPVWRYAVNGMAWAPSGMWKRRRGKNRFTFNVNSLIRFIFLLWIQFMCYQLLRAALFDLCNKTFTAFQYSIDVELLIYWLLTNGQLSDILSDCLFCCHAERLWNIYVVKLFVHFLWSFSYCFFFIKKPF